MNPMWFTEKDAWIEGEYSLLIESDRSLVPPTEPTQPTPPHHTQTHRTPTPNPPRAVDGVESSTACYTLLNGTYNAYCACRLGKFVFEEECDAGAYVANEIATNLPTYFLMVICIVWGSQVRSLPARLPDATSSGYLRTYPKTTPHHPIPHHTAPRRTTPHHATPHHTPPHRFRSSATSCTSPQQVWWLHGGSGVTRAQRSRRP